MFKLPVKLSARPGLHQLADFLEWDAWQNGFSSARAINAALGRIDDNPVEEGCEDSSDESAVLQKNDAGLDVVSWLPFADQKPNQLIIFAQCKTGDNWSSDHGKLKPEAFFKTWTQSKSVSLPPVSAYCIAEAADRTRWIEFTNQTGGLFFDRCRIVDYCDDLTDSLVKRINEWTNAALKHLSR